MKLDKLTIKEAKAELAKRDQISDQLLAKLREDKRKGINKLAEQIERKRAKEEALLAKFARMKKFEDHFWQQGQHLIAGIDEAGRGPLVGPVVAAAVIFPKDIHLPGLDDSKKLSQEKRETLFKEIKKEATAVGVGIVDSGEIDRINILQASYQAMRIAVNDLKYQPKQLLVDGSEIPNLKIEQLALIDGDSKSISIAAASIIAKVTRDQILINLDNRFPVYNFKQNKGYGTKEHIDALKEYGPTPLHRRSFSIVRQVEDNV